MKQLSFCVLLTLFSCLSQAAEWIQVKGGVAEFNFQQEKLENMLWEFVVSSSDNKFEPRADYTYQYQMITDSTLKIRALCNISNNYNLSANFLLVRDGGTCYFEAHYNTVSEKFIGFYINGVA